MNNCYAPVLVAGESFSIYANLDKPLSASPAGQLKIVDADTFQVKYAPGVPVQVLDIGEGYLHFFFKLSVVAANGFYRFILHDTATDKVSFVSSVIEFRQQPKGALKVQYRSEAERNRFFYDLLPDFFNVFYLDLVAHKPQPVEQSAGHSNIFDNYVRTRSLQKEYVTFATQWFDREAHNAFLAMTSHPILVIDGTRYIKDDSAEYSIQWAEGGGMGQGYDVACGEITLQNLDYLQESNDC